MLAIRFPYIGAFWREAWPRRSTQFRRACAATGARLVFVDNLYMYGPQTAPLSETTPLTPYGVKPAARVEVTRIWMAASEAGRLRVAALRAPDFYGPRACNRRLGETAFGALARRKTASVIGSPDTPHDFAYVPDFARAVVTLLDAPDDCFGRAWHVPCAPTRGPRRILALGAGGARRQAARLRPAAMDPRAARTVHSSSQGNARDAVSWDRPYRVDLSRFAKRFWSDATPFEIGAPATAMWYSAIAPTRPKTPPAVSALARGGGAL